MHLQSLRRARPSRLATLALAGAFVTLVSLSCREVTAPPIDLPLSVATFTGRWSGKPWEGGAYAYRYATLAGDLLVVHGGRPANAGEFIHETLTLRIPFRGVGTYVLGVEDVEVRDYGGGDILMATYEGVGAEAGELQITSYDEHTGRVEGTVSFAVRLGGTGAWGPVARFEDGQFQATIESVK